MKKTIKRVLVILLGSILWLSIFISNEFFNETNLYSNINNPVQFANGPIPPSMGQSLVFGTIAGPIDLDPHLCYDSSSQAVISQICEGLYKFNTTDPTYPIVPVLATALPTISPDGLNITIPLRTGVTFTDGTPFNATAVKWNFDRLNYFLNYSGNQFLPAPFNIPLPSDGSIQKTTAEMLFTLNSVPIINRTEVIGPYTIKIVMNVPKASFINLLTYHSTFFHSPTSAQAQGKELDYLTYADADTLIGTGPFIFQYYATNIEVNFIGNPNYWQGAPLLTELIFSIIQDTNALNLAVLAGDIDLCDAPASSFFDTFRADPDITLLEAGPTVLTSYMGFNGYMVNTTFRKAISYAINYSYLIDVVLSGEAYRLKSPIPEGIPMSNYSFNYPVFDRAYAQSIMQSMGYGTTFTTDADWTTHADGGGWGFGWNITAQTEGVTRRDFAILISDSLRYLGINAPVVQIPFGDLLTCIQNDVGFLRRDRIPMYMLGWGPDYIDPENYISPLYSNRSSIWVNTYDYELEQLMLAGETTVDILARLAIYNEIQRKLVEELYFFAWIATGKNYDVYQNYVKGWVPNAINVIDFYPVYLDIPDLIAPTIIIFFPILNQIYSYNSPDFAITVSDVSPINSTWYTIDGGLTNYTFSGLAGTINQTAWDNENSGLITLRFYANDSAGNVGFTDRIVIKDVLTPEITINSPIAGEEFTEPPDFTISIIEGNLDSTWYTVEGSLTQYPFIGLTGTIHQNAWDDAPEGDVTIAFYAEDRAGNMGSKSVVVKKRIPSKGPEIPGYNVLIITGISFIALFIITQKRRINIKK